MLLCFRCSPETRSQLDALVESGAYRDQSQAIGAAVENLLLLEKEFARQGAVVIEGQDKDGVDVEGNGDHPLPGRPQQKKSIRKRAPRGSTVPAEDKLVATTVNGTGKATAATRKRSEEVPRIFQLEGMPHSEPRGLVDVPADMWHHGQEVPLDRWILGQFNRLLPAKANCRALIHLFREKGALGIDAAAEEVANQALSLGDYLAAIDTKHKVQRDDALSTAFPQRKKDSEKARTRYANQFVVYQNSRGELSGLMIDLKLINVDSRRRERRIVPTHLAWEFAKLENPILDGIVNGAVQKFSEVEKELLLQHILRGVPVESFAYRVILQAVVAGSNTPETIDEALKRYVSQDRAENLSQSFLTSQRSGAISRMSDLGLIERQRDGVRVSYGITKEGRGFLSHYDSLS